MIYLVAVESNSSDLPELPKTDTGLETSDRTSYFPGAGIFVFIVELINFNFRAHFVPKAPKIIFFQLLCSATLYLSESVYSLLPTLIFQQVTYFPIHKCLVPNVNFFYSYHADPKIEPPLSKMGNHNHRYILCFCQIFHFGDRIVQPLDNLFL